MARFGKDCACASSDAPDKPNARAAAQSHIFQMRMQDIPIFVGRIVAERSTVCNPLLVSRSSLREAKRRSNPFFLYGSMDCFAEPVIGRAFARPVGSQ
jgi:hypothetical protein